MTIMDSNLEQNNKETKYEVAFGKIEDTNYIAQFQVDMALESEDLQLDVETLKPGVKAVMEDENKGKYIVARYDDKPIGSLLITKEWSDWRNAWYWWIQSVYVKPEHRGNGVYRSMYTMVKELAIEEGVSQIKLYVDKNNETAKKTYQSLGMQESHYLLYEEYITK